MGRLTKLQHSLYGICGDHRSLVCVQLEAPDRTTRYYFAYCRNDRTLVPMTDGTAKQFPRLMPVDDPVENINQLNRKQGTMSVGYGNLELPAKWFQNATRAERKGAGDAGERSRRVYSRLPRRT
jgi:hypothetical protein